MILLQKGAHAENTDYFQIAVCTIRHKIQDVIMPFRKKPFSPEMHLKVLRASIVFVAIFIFFFSNHCLFYMMTNIQVYRPLNGI